MALVVCMYASGLFMWVYRCICIWAVLSAHAGRQGSSWIIQCNQGQIYKIVAMHMRFCLQGRATCSPGGQCVRTAVQSRAVHASLFINLHICNGSCFVHVIFTRNTFRESFVVLLCLSSCSDLHCSCPVSFQLLWFALWASAWLGEIHCQLH